jgi:hypothetical protein
MNPDITEEVRNLIEQFSRMVNVMGSEKEVVEGLAVALLNEHRTLQASMVRVLLKGLVEYAKRADQHGMTDLRNEGAIKTLLKVSAVVQDNPIPFI